MSQQKRIDKILDEAGERAQTEVGALIGAPFTFTSLEKTPVTKEAVFEDLTGPQVCAHLDIDGDAAGKSCLLISVKDAIMLGGTLIMLPEAELEETVKQENYTEDIEDSFGEIANIIAGSYTKVFEDNYPKSCRFIRKEQELVKPAKVDTDSDELIANQMYYRASAKMELNGNALGDLIILLPAEAFELSLEEAPTAPPPESSTEPVQPEPAQTTSETAPEPSPSSTDTVKPKVDSKKQLKIIDRIVTEISDRAPEEIGGLLGVAFKFTGLDCKFVTKGECFDELTGPQVCAHIDIDGEVSGKSCMLLGFKGAISLGGTLIMLPEAELEEHISQENYTEDLEDSYGEIANILMGTYTKVFEDSYPKSCRLIRKEQEIVKPAKVDPESDDVIKNQLYYQISHTLELNGVEVGNQIVLLPAETFGLALDDESEEIAAPGQVQAEKKSPAAGQPVAEQASPVTAAPKYDPVKNRKKIDSLLSAGFDTIGGELSALLGVEVKVSDLKNDFVSKEEFFLDHVEGKQVVADLEMEGGLEGKSYLVASVKDAIYTGGVLVMLPPSELEIVVQQEDFDDDAQDAYGEISNIIAGIYSRIFEEDYAKKVRMIRRSMTQVAPMRVEVDSDEPVLNQQYYLSSMKLSIDGQDLGLLQLLLPADSFELAVIAGQATAAPAEQIETEGQLQVDQAAPASPSTVYDVLIVSNSPGDSQKLKETLDSKGYVVGVIGFGDNVYDYIPGQLKAIYLVMNEVNEQAFGVAIKLNAGAKVPLIAAGPAWTRTKVIQAVKYGISDILMTPAKSAAIDENISKNLVALAA